MISTSNLLAMITALSRRLQLVAASLVQLGTPNTWTAVQTFNDFTVLGAVGIKLLKLTGLTDAVAGNTASVAHGLTQAKILSCDVLVNDGTDLVLPSELDVTLQYSVKVGATDIDVTTALTATTVLNAPFTVLLTYEA